MTAALIIAAGQGKNRRPIEPDRDVGALSAVKRCVLTLQAAGVARVVVICGDREDGKTEKLVAHMNVTFLFGSDTGEMLDSVKLGLAFLQGKCDDVLIAYTDVPLFQVETVRALLEADGTLCVPVSGGRRGHPIRLAADCIPEILAYQGSEGLAGALRAAGLMRTEVPVEDAGILTHIQDRDGCEAVLSVQKGPALRPAFRFQLVRDQPFYGPGAHQLLQLTEETGALLEACRHMGISYSKGRKIIANLERQMGCPILERTRGGKDGGASTVTADGRALIRNYSAFCEEAEAYLTELFTRYFDPR